MAGLLSRPTPSPRYWHFSASCGGKVVVWGGLIEDFLKNRERLGSVVETFDPFLERWEQQPTTGAPPLGLYNGACTSIQDSLFTYGGLDGSSRQSGLYHLCISAMEWRKLEERIPQDGPMGKAGCRMVQFNDTFVLFGGYGFPRAAIQPGSSFVKNKAFSDGRGWTNEFHLFDVKKGVWSFPPTTGTRPPPCSNFSLTKVVHNRAVLFGGCSSIVWFNDVYIIDLQAMSWAKMDKPEGAAWPVERSDHAACCLNYGQEHPQLLISGGVDKDHKILGDAWLLSVATGTWREIILPEGMPSRWGHSLTATSLAPGLTEVTMFGGCTEFSSKLFADEQPMIADTAVLTLGYLPSSEEWGLLRVARGGELGSLERVGEKMADISSKMSRLQQVKPALPASTHLQQMDKPPSLFPSLLHDSKETESVIRPELKWERDATEAERKEADNIAVTERLELVSEKDALRAQLAEMYQSETSTVTMSYLHGVDVVADTSFEVTSQAHTYEWRGYGVKLHIQQDSLPADCRQCRVKITASLSGQYALPAKCELVSGVYWVYCPVKFSKRATLEVQHCSTRRECLSFVRAECTQEHLPYVFRRQEGGVFSEHSSHGSIELSRFSGWGISWLASLFASDQSDSQQSDTSEPQPDSQQSGSPQSSSQQSDSSPYSAQVYYANDILNVWNVLFTVRCRRGLDIEDMEFSSRLEAATGQTITKFGPMFYVEFTDDRIRLVLPVITPVGWSLICPSHPAILRRIVDGFRAHRGDLIPHCQISVSGTAADVGSVLIERVSLDGAMEPYDYFTLQCGPTSADPGPALQPQPVRSSEPARLSDNQRPSVQQQQSPELRVFQEKRFILHTGILNNIQDIARRAFAWHLIPGGVSRIITDPFNHLTTDERTDQLLKELESRVKIDPAVLMKFVDMLRESDAACYSTLISNITEALDAPPAEQQQH